MSVETPQHPSGSTDSAIQLSDNPSLQKQSSSAAFGHPLQVDFTWKKFRATITPKGSSSNTTPLYDVQCRAFSPNYIFKLPAQGNATIGTGTLHAFNIKSTCKIHGKDIELQPLKKLATKYNYLSYAFKRPDGSRAVLIWEGTCGLKYWNFVCLDEHQLPLARIKANMWGVHDMGSIEFMNPTAVTEAMRDEIVITGIMIYQQMMLRTTNILNLAGAAFSKTGPVREGKNE